MQTVFVEISQGQELTGIRVLASVPAPRVNVDVVPFPDRDAAHEWCWDFVRSGLGDGGRLSAILGDDNLYSFTIDTNNCNRELRVERVRREMQMNPLPC